MTTLEIVLIVIVSVMLAIPPLGNAAVAMLRRAGKERAALWLEGAIPLAVRVMRVALTVGSAVAAKTSAASLLEESEEEADRPTDPPSPPSPPKLPIIGGMLICLALTMLAGCGGASFASVGTDVANAGAAAAEAAAPVLAEVCIEPMKEAAATHDVDAGRAIARRCDPAIAAFDLLRTAHVALRAGIVATVAGRAPANMAVIVSDVVEASARLGAAIGGLR